ncbi:hypothetical protein ACFLQN_04850 [Candidatus Aenigmatarchaeota archaeon]
MPRKIRFEIPEMKKKKIVSREYKMYKEEEREASIPRSIYEKACNFAEKFMSIEPDVDTKKKIKEAIDFSHLNVTPNGVASLTLFTAFVMSVPLLILIMLGIVGLPGLAFGDGIMGMILIIPFIYYIYVYPMRLKKKYEISIGSEIVTMILYMAMFMRNTPSLEGAVRFASENITGPVAYELRKLMWDLEIRKYITIEDALRTYSNKWKKNREFVESIELLSNSINQVGPRRIEMLDEAVELTLEGHREKAQHFSQNLKMPVAIVHAMGVLLPVLGLVLFPIVSVFLQVESSILLIGYDVILPFILFFIIVNILELRPVTYSKIDIKENPDVPEEGKFLLKGKAIKAWPIGLVIAITLSSFGIFLLMVLGTGDIIPPLVIAAGPTYGIAVYYLLLTQKRLEVREKTRAIEDEFSEALFQLGNDIYGGTPIELSIDKSIKRIENLKIRDLFRKAQSNMKTLGFTFSQAFFDKEYGAIRYYPSKMIKSVMKTVVETTKKGVKVASVAMISVSKYMKNIHNTQEYVNNMLSDSVNSLKFQLYFLSPFISGVIVTMAIIIIRILEELGQRIGSASAGGVSGGMSFGLSFGEVNVTAFEFVFIITIYLIETALILSYFINGIESGEDDIGRKNMTAKALIIGYIVFAASLIGTLAIFGPLILQVVT